MPIHPSQNGNYEKLQILCCLLVGVETDVATREISKEVTQKARTINII